MGEVSHEEETYVTLLVAAAMWQRWQTYD